MNYFNLLYNFFKLRGNAKKSQAQMKTLQKQKLETLLHYAWDHSAWHRRRFENAGITRDQLTTLPLSSFPTMDKRDLLDHFDELVTADGLHQADLRRFDEEKSLDERAFLGQYHVVHSSGSTGNPGYFVYDNAAWGQMLLGIIRGALWGMRTSKICSLLFGGPRILYIAAVDGRYGGAMAVGDGVEGLHAKQLHLDINKPLSEWIDSIRAFKPNLIIGYPSAIKIFGELVEQGTAPANILRVISCGEPLGPSLRGYLEKTFRCDVVNFYGASESLALGVETGDVTGMALFDDLNIIEVEDGVMYLTCLYNFVQPLIRYRISDHLTLRQPVVDSPFTRADILLGREEDMLWFEDENGGREFLHPLAIEGFCIDGLRDFQFRQSGADSFEMLAETTAEEKREPVRGEMLRFMGRILREKRLDYVRFSVQFVDSILPDPHTGKKKLIVYGAVRSA